MSLELYGGERRRELLVALAAVCDSPPPGAVTTALGLEPVDAAAHTEAFVLNCPPYAAVYLGPEGKLGGEAAERVAGFWRAVGLDPPGEPDHLAALLALLGNLAAAADGAGRPATQSALARMRRALAWEHLWSWVPIFAASVSSAGAPPVAAWAELLTRALAAELHGGGPATTELPLALRDSPPPLEATSLEVLLDGLVSPVRCGFALNRRDVLRGARGVGVGHRVAERRFALRAMLEQDPAGSFGWLSAHARRSAARWDRRPDVVSQWWSERASGSAALLGELAASAAASDAAERWVPDASDAAERPQPASI